MVGEAQSTPARPALRIVRGNPTAEEVAALVAVLTARAARTTAAPPRPVAPGWRDRATTQRQPLRPGPGAWRASALRG